MNIHGFFLGGVSHLYVNDAQVLLMSRTTCINPRRTDTRKTGQDSGIQVKLDVDSIICISHSPYLDYINLKSAPINHHFHTTTTTSVILRRTITMNHREGQVQCITCSPPPASITMGQSSNHCAPIKKQSVLGFRLP